MKQCIKYLMILLLGVLLYDGAAQAAGISSQAPTSHQQNIRNIYNRFLSTSLYIDNVDSTQVPGNKSVLLLLNYFRMRWLAESPACGSLLHASFYPVPDPLSYYVFGLRKIII